MKPKILIQVKGGNVIHVASNQPVEILLVDYDNEQNGSEAVGDVIENDYTFINGQAYRLFSKDDAPIRNSIKNINF